MERGRRTGREGRRFRAFTVGDLRGGLSGEVDRASAEAGSESERPTARRKPWDSRYSSVLGI